VDEDGFIQRQTVTAGNVNDSVERDTLRLGDETALYADATYRSKETRDKRERFGIADQVQRKGYPLAGRALHDREAQKPMSVKDRRRNDTIAVIRAGGERPFTTYKSRYG
jgi:IS5 family transposase